MAFKEILGKIQSQSELKRKIILWVVMGVIGTSVFAWWIVNAKNALSETQSPSIGEQLKINELQERFNEIPVQFDGEQQ